MSETDVDQILTKDAIEQEELEMQRRLKSEEERTKLRAKEFR